MNPTEPFVYIPALPSLGSRDIALYGTIHDARINLVTQLAANGFHVHDIDGQRPWLKTMLKQADDATGFLFPPMTSLPEHHPRYQSEAAQRWFEFFSLTTGVHVGSREKYLHGISKPCVVMDPDGQWDTAIGLLKDLQLKGMFSSSVEEIVQVVRGDPGQPQDYNTLNRQAIATLSSSISEKKGKTRTEVRYAYPEDRLFSPFRKRLNRHPFGIALFGSATTTEPGYRDGVAQLCAMTALRGWRMITGAGVYGCMGAADAGYEEGRRTFLTSYPSAPFQPSHIGISTQAILRLEGPPPHIDQLIITGDIYDRIKVMIKGQKGSDRKQRVRDAVKVLFISPGGTGTLHEFATLMQLATNGSMMDDRKVVILNLPSHLDPAQGFWDPLIRTAQRLGFASLFEVANTPEEAITIADRIYMEWLERHPEHKDLPHPALNPVVV